MNVQDLMTRDVVTTTPAATLKEAAALMVEKGLSGLPVVDEVAGLVGVLSEADVLAKERAEPPRRGVLHAVLHPAEALDDRFRLDARLVVEAMSSPVVTIGPRAPLARAAATMADAGVKRLPVVDEDGSLVGILTRTDLLRAFVRSDAEIEREVREDVLTRTLWLPPGAVTVAVEHGVVTLTGHVETETDAEIAPALVRRVAGVVDVRSSLSWDRGRKAVAVAR